MNSGVNQMEDKSLTPRQERFVEEYVADGNATRSAEAAGYSKQAAHVQGSRLLKNDKVQAAIVEANVNALERSHINQDSIIQSLWKEAKDMRNPASVRVQSLSVLAEHR
jgi:phage terminase small subunit